MRHHNQPPWPVLAGLVGLALALAAFVAAVTDSKGVAASYLVLIGTRHLVTALRGERFDVEPGTEVQVLDDG